MAAILKIEPTPIGSGGEIMSYPVVLEKNEDGRWTVSCPVLPGCLSEGDTREEALENIKDAIHLYLRAVKKELAILKQKGRQVVNVAA